MNGIRRELAATDTGAVDGFTLEKVDSSWVEKLALGAIDYYGSAKPMRQLVAKDSPRTIDIPEMRQPWSAETAPAWRWVEEPWALPFDESCTVLTNLRALQGEPITETMRWDDGEWELYAGDGSQVTDEDRREVAFGTLIANDPSLLQVAELQPDSGLWRASAAESWRPWASHSK